MQHGILALALRDQFSHRGNEFVRNIHYRLGRLNASLILGQSVLLGLLLVMGEYSPHLLFVPIGWKLVFAYCCFFLLRLRDAPSGLPARS